jgi:hypothetical protein
MVHLPPFFGQGIVDRASIWCRPLTRVMALRVDYKTGKAPNPEMFGRHEQIADEAFPSGILS